MFGFKVSRIVAAGMFSVSGSFAAYGGLLIRFSIRSLAWAELYVGIAELFSRYDFTLYNTNIEDIETGSDQFLPGLKTENGVRVTVRKTPLQQK